MTALVTAKSMLYVLEGDGNPEYTPEVFYLFFETEQEAINKRDGNPEVFSRIFSIECPTCKERASPKLKPKEFLDRKMVCGFDLDIAARAQQEAKNPSPFVRIGGNESGFYICEKPDKKSIRKLKQHLSWGDLSMHPFECPRCDKARAACLQMKTEEEMLEALRQSWSSVKAVAKVLTPPSLDFAALPLKPGTTVTLRG